MAISPAEAKRLLAKRQAELLKNQKRFVLEDFLFKEQLAFVQDPARFATAVTSVRAGKTTSCAADLIDTALKMPGTTGLYITLARSSAKKIVWPELHAINNKFKLNIKMNETELACYFPNGSKIYCSGANTEAEMEKVRGLSNVALAYIDESQAFRAHIKELVNDILIKRLYDTNGRCRLIGTPGPIPAGYFYDASQSPKWSHHHWTLHSNIHVQRKSGMTAEQLIQQDMDMRGVTIEHPSIQRECFGIWKLDSNSLLLNYNADLNHYDTLPMGEFHYILGIDLGIDDADSLSVLGWQDNSPNVYLIEEVLTVGQGVEALSNQVDAITKKYTFSKMRIDTGGLGKKIAEDLKSRKGIPVEAAEKQEKLSNYAFLNSALQRGHFKAKKDSRFAQDCNILERDRDKSTPDRIIVKGHSDAVDSVLYAFKDSPAYSYQPPPKEPIPGSPEWAAREEDRMRTALYERIKAEQDEMNQQLYQEPENLDLTKWRRS